MSEGELPHMWRTAAIIKTLLMEGKDSVRTDSYRSISLGACLGKLLEMIIVDRMAYILEEKG